MSFACEHGLRCTAQLSRVLSRGVVFEAHHHHTAAQRLGPRRRLPRHVGTRRARGAPWLRQFPNLPPLTSRPRPPMHARTL